MDKAQQKYNKRLLVLLLKHVEKIENQTRKRLFDLSTFQSNILRKVKYTKKQIIRCNTQCCVSGWIAVCPAFTEQGVIPDRDSGAATIKNPKWKGQYDQYNYETYDPTETFQILFGCTSKQATDLIYMGHWKNADPESITIKDCIKFINTW